LDGKEREDFFSKDGKEVKRSSSFIKSNYFNMQLTGLENDDDDAGKREIEHLYRK
jgi:hypothetical protein